MTISFPSDFPRNLTGFGGDPSMNQAQHQAALRKTPVILVHGNGGHSTHPKWGMETLKGFLKGEGYQDCEIWAMDHLGENNIGADLNDPHRNHIDALRRFVDRVREYLDVSKLDFIGHSLGCGMINAYLRGLQRDGRWDGSTHRLEVASTFVSLAGATYGLGPNSVSEFKSGSPFEQASHTIELPVHGRVVDDSPRGSGNAAEQQSPTPDWVKITTSDDNSICYVAFTAVGDFVDAQNRDTGRREGADVNRRFNLGVSLDGHEKIIKSRTVFDAFKSFLNRNPPLPPATISVDKDSGSYGAGLEIRVTVAPATVPVRYVAERVTRQFQGGFIVRQVAETRSGKLASDQSLVLAPDGAWDVVFGADGAKQVHRVYGVNVTMPQVTILTESDAPFVNGSLDVTASTTGGTLYHGTDGEHWTAGSVATITRTATVSFVAIDAGGVASPVASRAFEKPVAWDEAQTATLTAHFIASRLSVNDYVAMGLELGFNAVVTLYRVDGRWVRNPEQAGLAPRRALPALVPGVSPLRAPVAADREPLLVADAASGEYSGALNVTISTASPRGGRVKVWYTEDGSDPSDPGNTARASLDTQKTFAIRGNGHHSVLCYVRDSAGRHGFESFAWAIDDHEYPETGISPSLGGVYAGRVAVRLQSSEPCQWTKYTIDGTEPSDANGANCIPGQPIVIDKTTTLKFRSKDLAGNIEPVKAAAFTIEGPVTELVFDNDPDRDGYVKADASGRGVQVGTFSSLAVGLGRDDRDCRAAMPKSWTCQAFDAGRSSVIPIWCSMSSAMTTSMSGAFYTANETFRSGFARAAERGGTDRCRVINSLRETALTRYLRAVEGSCVDVRDLRDKMPHARGAGESPASGRDRCSARATGAEKRPARLPSTIGLRHSERSSLPDVQDRLPMTIDIDRLTEAELIDLNRRIVERLRFLQQMRAHKDMLSFRIGERVSFEPADRPPVFGILTRYNRKTVTVITEDGRQWNVSPHLLRKVKPANEQNDVAHAKVVSLKEVL